MDISQLRSRALGRGTGTDDSPRPGVENQPKASTQGTIKGHRSTSVPFSSKLGRREKPPWFVLLVWYKLGATSTFRRDEGHSCTKKELRLESRSIRLSNNGSAMPALRTEVQDIRGGRDGWRRLNTWSCGQCPILPHDGTMEH